MKEFKQQTYLLICLLGKDSVKNIGKWEERIWLYSELIKS